MQRKPGSCQPSELVGGFSLLCRPEVAQVLTVFPKCPGLQNPKREVVLILSEVVLPMTLSGREQSQLEFHFEQ